MSCTCSDQHKALTWTAQGPTPHEESCPDAPRAPRFDEWVTLPENVWEGIAFHVKRGINVRRIVLSFAQWDRYVRWLLGQPHIAKVSYGTATLLTALGEIDVIPGDVPDNRPRYEP